jgi:protease II
LIVPLPDGSYWYYTRTYHGKSYPTYCHLQLSIILLWMITNVRIVSIKKLSTIIEPLQVQVGINNSNKGPVLVYEKENDLLWVYLYKSNDKEQHKQLLHCISKRWYKVRYTVDHKDNLWYISSNVNDKTNMALYVSPAIN